ncbi:aminopeptidase N-like [Chrysoperla carnea]|uniref:aminopeptidase N-like n=1 Tax=Chrysoperla carnea TaxID=189513 RepID=UPI001D078D50|nr:aminopeptidase N-like [Chrysoperla carnea]
MLKNAHTTTSIFIYCSVCIFWIINASTAAQNYRLPKSIVPEHYTININTYLDNEFKFNGYVVIKLKVVEPTNVIQLHSADLDIPFDEVKLLDNDENKIEIDSQSFDKEQEFYTITLNDYLKNDDKNYSLFIPFAGNLTEGLAGFYRSSYIDRATNEKKWLATTQFESTDARRAFPCFDEPEMKAKFKISLGHNSNYTAISNMPLEKSEETGEGWIVDYFQESVKMSTYLVAFIVSDFDFKNGDNITDTIFRVWARKDALDQVDYAASVGPKYLQFYEDYFDIKFPLPKQDMIAIPDFNAGAMENWGLITYRETALLYDPNISSASSQHRVASVIAHELAHQWFGNLVTMKWWTDLWLNEGFATFMAAKAIHAINPEWNSLNDENIENMIAIYKLDRLESSHPISVTIGHPSEIAQIFDVISYRKGSFILRMITLFLGEDVFRQGVSNYLRKYAYGNAVTDDLWAALSEEAHKRGVLQEGMDVKTIMDTWTVQTGYPLVTVTRNPDGGLEVNQERFVIGAKQRDTSCWWVPLSYTTAKSSDFNDTTPKDWLKCDSNAKQLPTTKLLEKGLPENDEWILLNIQSAGLYKVNYDDKNWDLLIKALIEDHNSIPVLNRVQLIDDSMDLANAGRLNYNVSLRLLTYLVAEDEYLAWNTALDHLNYLKIMLSRRAVFGLFTKYIKQLVTPIYEKVSYELAEKSIEAIKRQVLISAWACRFDIGDCQEQSAELFKNWMNSKNSDEVNPIPKDLRGVVYCTAIRKGGEKEWNFLWQKYLKSNVGSEKVTFLHALGCTSEQWILNRYLDWSLNSTSGIRKQDMIDVFGTVSNSPLGFYLAKDFLKSRITDLAEYLGQKSDRLTRYIKSLARQMHTPLELEELEKFTQKHENLLKDSSLGIQQALEGIRKNIDWQNKHYNEISTLFETMDKIERKI